MILANKTSQFVTGSKRKTVKNSIRKILCQQQRSLWIQINLKIRLNLEVLKHGQKVARTMDTQNKRGALTGHKLISETLKLAKIYQKSLIGLSLQDLVSPKMRKVSFTIDILHKATKPKMLINKNRSNLILKLDLRLNLFLIKKCIITD